MKRLILSLAVSAALAVPAVALACEDHQGPNAAKPSVKKVEVSQLAELQKDKKTQVFDVNGPETRSRMGVIPGATLLTSATQFDPAKELPAQKDTKLVFYCANTQCTSSQSAAQRAIEAGFTDVSVLPAGIKGWREAGQKTSVPHS